MSLTALVRSPCINAQLGDLTAGDSVSITLEFTNSDNNNGITYTPRALGGPGLR